MKKIISGTLGNCVHVAGIMNYLNLASKENYSTEFIGIGKTIEELVHLIKTKKTGYSSPILQIDTRTTSKNLTRVKRSNRRK